MTEILKDKNCDLQISVGHFKKKRLGTLNGQQICIKKTLLLMYIRQFRNLSYDIEKKII